MEKNLNLKGFRKYKPYGLPLGRSGCAKSAGPLEFDLDCTAAITWA